VALTPAGSAYPYGKDPDDRHIRLAPTLPPLAEVETAMDVVGLCALLAACRAALAD
jgi:DNA-binding transcriptional MocR family regulator